MSQEEQHIRLAQKCYHCGKYLYCGQEIVPDPKIKDWVSHRDCVIPDVMSYSSSFMDEKKSIILYKLVLVVMGMNGTTVDKLDHLSIDMINSLSRSKLDIRSMWALKPASTPNRFLRNVILNLPDNYGKNGAAVADDANLRQQILQPLGLQ